MNSLFTIALVVMLFIMFGGTIKLLINSLVNSLLPLARSLEVYSEGVEKKTRLNVTKDVAKTEFDASNELNKINSRRASKGLPEVNFEDIQGDKKED